MNPPDAPGDFSDRDTVTPVPLKIGSVRWQVRSPAVAEAFASLLRDPEALLARKESLIHDTWLVAVARVSSPMSASGHALLRRSNYAKPSARRRDFFRTAGPLRAFRTALALERAGIPTPRVLAAGVARRFNVPQAGYLLVEEIAPAVTLAKLAQQSRAVPQAAVRRVAEAIARLHELGFIHGDLTINNVLLDERGQPWFIDLERGRKCGGPLSWRQSVEDFHRFARHVGKFSAAARFSSMRLLSYYCTVRGWPGREQEFVAALSQRLKHKLDGD